MIIVMSKTIFFVYFHASTYLSTKHVEVLCWRGAVNYVPVWSNVICLFHIKWIIAHLKNEKVNTGGGNCDEWSVN